jgi:HEAT repeat protein
MAHRIAIEGVLRSSLAQNAMHLGPASHMTMPARANATWRVGDAYVAAAKGRPMAGVLQREGTQVRFMPMFYPGVDFAIQDRAASTSDNVRYLFSGAKHLVGIDKVTGDTLVDAALSAQVSSNSGLSFVQGLTPRFRHDLLPLENDLVKLLKSEKYEQAYEFIIASKDTRLLRYLDLILRAECSEELKGKVFNAIVELGSKEFIPYLERIAENGSKEMKTKAKEVLLAIRELGVLFRVLRMSISRMAETPSSTLGADAAKDLAEITSQLEVRLNGSTLHKVRVLIQTIGQVGGEKSLQALIQFASSENPLIQECAVKELARYSDLLSSEALLDVMTTTSHENVFEAAGLSLALIRDLRVLDALNKAREEVANEATVYAWMKVNFSTKIDLVLPFTYIGNLKNDGIQSPELYQSAAYKILGEIGGEDAAARLRQRILELKYKAAPGSAEAEELIEVIRAYGKTKVPSAMLTLNDLLDNRDRGVVLAAVEAMAEIGNTNNSVELGAALNIARQSEKAGQIIGRFYSHYVPQEFRWGGG